MDENNNKAN
jgi:hypothetical protein